MILITGGMGFIGLHTARAFIDAGEEVVLMHFRTWRLPEFLQGEVGTRLHALYAEPVDLVRGLALLDVLRKHHVTGIVHLAAPAALGPDPAEQYWSATQGLVNVLEAARQQGVARVSVASSVAVYLGAGAGPWREDRPLPVESGSYTSAMKKAIEVLSLHFADRTGLDVRVLRLATIYGPLYRSMSNLPSRLCRAAVSGTQPELDTRGVRTPYAEDTVDLLHVRDCAAAIGLVHRAARLQHRVYNVGAGRAVTNDAIADAVRRTVPGAQVTLPSHEPEADAANAYMDIARLQEDTGYAAGYDLELGIAEYIAWLRGHPQ
jgi:UDP-glucose 4-epimerase